MQGIKNKLIILISFVTTSILYWTLEYINVSVIFLGLPKTFRNVIFNYKWYTYNNRMNIKNRIGLIKLKIWLIKWIERIKLLK